jgi:hypothetical protein
VGGYFIRNSDFFFSAAVTNGGAIQGVCSGIIIESCNFFYNKAGRGGAVFIAPLDSGDGTSYAAGNVSIKCSNFIGNSANTTCSRNSGAVVLVIIFNIFEIVDCYFERNTVGCTTSEKGVDI